MFSAFFRPNARKAAPSIAAPLDDIPAHKGFEVRVQRGAHGLQSIERFATLDAAQRYAVSARRIADQTAHACGWRTPPRRYSVRNLETGKFAAFRVWA